MGHLFTYIDVETSSDAYTSHVTELEPLILCMQIEKGCNWGLGWYREEVQRKSKEIWRKKVQMELGEGGERWEEMKCLPFCRHNT